MWDSVKEIKSGNGENVSKFIFQKEDAIAEAVLYTYDDYLKRTVICCSTQSGCPVGCVFCGTGKKFIRNLTADEILYQVHEIVSQLDPRINVRCKKFQIMFMSMGEPMLNWKSVSTAITYLNNMYPNAELLISTIGINDPDVFNDLVYLSKTLPKVGLQFSIHEAYDSSRNQLIPFKNKWNLKQIRDAGLVWWKETGRKPYLNYCVTGANSSDESIQRLQLLFSPAAFNFTFSVVCSADETMKGAGERNLDHIRDVENQFKSSGYNTRVFDPAGQDDIGGGCGQLWHVQKWMKEREEIVCTD